MSSPPTGVVEDFSSALFHNGRQGLEPEIAPLVGGLPMAQEFAHVPVLLSEVVAAFGPVPPGVVVDGTVGGGGHASALLAAYPAQRLLGVDRDRDALAAARERLAPFGDRAVVRQSRFGDLGRVVAEAGLSADVVGVLLDLGVSSPQIDRGGRGFSYRTDGPLDMRMDQGAGPGAADLVNEGSEQELAELFVANGEGRLARRIARAIIAARPVRTTGQLADVVARAVPAANRRRGHPARRVFQALRIAVNDELGQLESVLPTALSLLRPGGRMAVISYHSGEDRLVKAAFGEAERGGCTCPPGLPCVCGAAPVHRLVFRGARKAPPDEVALNRRAESARLRVIERMQEGESR